MENLDQKLKELYAEIPWPSDPESEEGKKYFERSIKSMETLVDHSWITELSGLRKIKVLEICGGAGFGSIALGKVLKGRNIDTEILITDLRSDSLENARNWGKKLGLNVETKVLDAREVYKIEDRFDIALMFGLSTPHFNPWDMVKILSSVSSVLNPDGILAIEESDRRYRIFLNNSYKWVLGEGDENKLVLSIHSGYDIVKGVVKRTYVSLNFASKPLTMEMYMWGLAELGALTWTFFEDVDLIPLKREARFFVIAHNPRKKPMDPSETPTILKNKEGA